MDGWTDGRMDGWTDFPCVLQDFVPFGAAALLPFNLTLLKQGTGTADHLTLLRLLVLKLGFGLKAGFLASKLGFWPQGCDLGLKVWDLGLKVGIWTARLKFGPQGWDLGVKAGI